MLAEELGLRNFLNINVVYTRKLAQSITSLSLPSGDLGEEDTQTITPTHSHDAPSAHWRSGEIQTAMDSTRPAERHFRFGLSGGTGLHVLCG
jgi:hypothetical protein